MRHTLDETSSLPNSVGISMIEKTLSEFIATNFILGEDENVGHDVSLVATGVMDSTSALELAEFIEATFNIKVLDRDINPDNLETVGRIAQFVASKIGADD